MSRVGDEVEDVLLLSLTGLVSQDSEEDVVVQVSGLSRGDKRRNAKLAELRRLVPVDHAILGIDLADRKQAVVICDHDSQVLARKTVTVRAWDLGPVLDWARGVARKHGFAGVTVGCEPTGASLDGAQSACYPAGYDVGVCEPDAGGPGPRG
jgi:transposase